MRALPLDLWQSPALAKMGPKATWPCGPVSPLFWWPGQALPQVNTAAAMHGASACMMTAVAWLSAGLTLGLMGLDRLELEVLLRSGTAKEKRWVRVPPVA